MSECENITNTKSRRKEKDMRRVRSLPPMTVIIPFIMVNRIGAMNLMKDRIPVTKLEKFLR